VLQIDFEFLYEIYCTLSVCLISPAHVFYCNIIYSVIDTQWNLVEFRH